MVNKLISNSIQTGLITAACAGVDLALFVSFTSRNYHYVPAYILGKLYTNSLLATLNSRRAVMQISSLGPSLTSGQESFGMRLQVTRVTERRTDSESVIGASWSAGKVDFPGASSVELGPQSRLGDSEM
ncbi:hypothetical protein CPC08DRAFT_457920 [Agrocybe pediades]|nr:hypothetical protein CPC08DRAFT_457920 [Agrocybe pediades]